MPRIIVFSSCGTRREARKIADDLVRRRLAACVNIFRVNSCYRWKGRIVNGEEWMIVIKTNSIVFLKLKRRILTMHSYQLPEFISFKIDGGSRPYLKWIDREVSGGQEAQRK